MKQSEVDLSILYAWAGLPPTIQDGYKHVVYNDGQPITARQAKVRVHRALKRYGFFPHDSKKLPEAWLYWHRYFEKNGGELT